MKRYKTQAAVPPDYAGRIRALRDKHNLSQARLADLIGVAVPTISRWESGQARPTEAIWRQIAEMELFGLDAASATNAVARQAREATGAYLPATGHSPVPDFTAAPETVRTVVEGHRLERVMNLSRDG